MKERFSRQETLDVAADSTNKVFTLPELVDLTPVYFLKLTLHDSSGKLIGSNFYWFSNKPETITHGIVNLGDGFAKTYADFRALNELPKTTIKASSQTTQEHGDVVTHITLRNDDTNLALFIRLNLSSCSENKEILPIVWSDNYISLMPGETREVAASYHTPGPEPVRVDLYGWNVSRLQTGCVTNGGNRDQAHSALRVER
jgi:exo-1,4-beta-D-glucosaminidase